MIFNMLFLIEQHFNFKKIMSFYFSKAYLQDFLLFSMFITYIVPLEYLRCLRLIFS